MMDGNWPAAVLAAIERIGISQVGDVPHAGHALLNQEMHAFDEGGGLAGRVGAV
jgi:hypothetical protein